MSFKTLAQSLLTPKLQDKSMRAKCKAAAGVEHGESM
jgi:hypothetical protein